MTKKILNTITIPSSAFFNLKRWLGCRLAGMGLVGVMLLILAPIGVVSYDQNPIYSAEVSAGERREHLVKVNRWGAYVVEAKGAAGVRMEVADKLRGVFAVGTDGWMKMFLEAGYYKIFTKGPENAQGILNVTVTGFSQSDSSDYEYLNPYEQTPAQLKNMEMKAWWIFVPNDTLVYIEAMGRHLGGLAVLRGGEWIVAEENVDRADDKKNIFNRAVPEKPLHVLRVVKQLQRGKHLVVAFGSGEDKFTVSDDESPLYVQWMVEPVGQSQRDSLQPQTQYNYHVMEDGKYRLSSLHALNIGDYIGVSGVLVDLQDSSIVALAADTVSLGRGLRREFNLLRENTSYLWVDETGTYSFIPKGDPDYDWRVKRFYVTPPQNYGEPRKIRGKSEIMLDKGLHVIELFPTDDGGTAAFTIVGKSVDNDTKAIETVETERTRTSVNFETLDLKKDREYRFYLNYQLPILSSMHLEKYPLPVDDKTVYLTGNAAECEEANIPQIPKLKLGVPQYAMVGKRSSKTYRFTVDEAGIYKLETTGRLNMSLTVRNRAGAEFVKSDAAVIGRNAMIVQYFLPGNYLLVAESRGESAGQMGVVFSRGPLRYGGILEDGVDKRALLKASEAVVYDFVVSRDGHYRIESFWEFGSATVRLEDASSGWPIFALGLGTAPGVAFKRGVYRLYALPRTHENKRVTRVQHVKEMSEQSGYGSHNITTTDLIAGLSYYIDTVRSIRVNVSEDGLYEIYSQGRLGISARLYSEDNVTEIARNGSDSRDWNFVITERLKPGIYHLRLDPELQSVFHPTYVFMRRVEDTLAQTVKLDGYNKTHEQKISMTGKEVIIPFEISSAPLAVLTFTASGNSRIVCVLEEYGDTITTVTGLQQGKKINISAPLGAMSNRGALRIWSTDRANDDINITLKTNRYEVITFEKAQSGISGTAIAEHDNTIFYTITGMRGSKDNNEKIGGHYELITTQNDIKSVASSTDGTIFQKAENSLMASTEDRLWVKATFKSSGRFRFVVNPVLLADPKETAEKNRRRFETADKFRTSRNQIRHTIREELPVTVKSGENKIFAFDNPTQTLGLITFSMDQGQPIVGLSASNLNQDKNLDFFTRVTARQVDNVLVRYGQHIDERVSMTAVIPGDTGKIVGWNALSGGSAQGIGGRFTKRDHALETADTLRTGRIIWRAETASAKEYHLDPNNSRTVIANLSPRTGIFYVSPDGIRDMYYGGENGATHTLELEGGNLFLFGGTDGVAGSIELETFASLPAASPASTVKHFTTNTREQIRTVLDTSSSAHHLFWSDSVENVSWINQHWESENAPVIKEMSRLTMRAGVNWYAIESADTVHASLTAPVPSAAVMLTDGRIIGYREFWDELSIDAPLNPGKFTIGIKPLPGRSLENLPLTIRLNPIPVLTEDAPLEMYLAPGQKRLVKFVVAQPQTQIGIGISANAETPEAHLFDENHHPIARGRQIFTPLAKGTYHVLISTQKNSNGANIKLYLFGQNNPPQNPPADRILRIIGGGARGR